MFRRAAIALLVLLLPAVALAQPAAKGKAPEAMLAENTVLFVRFDGLEPHRKAYDQTAFAELMRGDAGKLVDYLSKYVTETLAEQLKQLPPGGDIPPQLLKMQSLLSYIPQLAEYFKKYGFVMGVELLDLEAPRTHMTLVLPHAAERRTRDVFFAVIQLIAQAAELKIKEVKAGARTLYQLEGTDPVTVTWWAEGDHLVFSAGTEKPEHVLAVIDGSAKNLTTNPLYKSVAGFNSYETALRAFVDLEKALAMVQQKFPPAAPVIQEFGLDGLKSVTILSGFDGKYDRSTVAVNVAKERKGLLRLLKPAGSIEAANLPPIPPDATSVTAVEFDVAGFYDVALQTVQGILKLAAPDELPKVQEAIKTADMMAGVNIRQDLIGSLGTSMVMYNSPSEGLFFLGNGCALKVKDQKKLQSTLEKICKSISAQTGVEVSIRTHKYNEHELFTIHAGVPGFFISPTFAFYTPRSLRSQAGDGGGVWMVAGLYPQVVQGFLLRTTGKYPTWKPSDTLAKALADTKKIDGAKITSISETDPRPTVKFLLSIAPIGAGLANSFVPGGFDVTMVPNAHSVCQPLFPNVSLTLDDGQSIRFESYASLSLPDIGPSYLMFSMFGGMASYLMEGRGAFPVPPVPVPAVPVPAPAPPAKIEIKKVDAPPKPPVEKKPPEKIIEKK
jgi:hypothetical protein